MRPLPLRPRAAPIAADLLFRARAGPDALLAKRNEFHEGKCTRDELKAVEDQAIKDEVKRQLDVGIKAVTDGEFRRHMCVHFVLSRRRYGPAMNSS